MFKFSQTAYEDALRRGVVFNDGGDAQGDHEITFDNAKHAIENIELYESVFECFSNIIIALFPLLSLPLSIYISLLLSSVYLFSIDNILLSFYISV